MPPKSFAEMRAEAAKKTANLMAANPGNAAVELKKELAETAPVAEVAVPSETKRYFAKVASSRFIFSDGVEVFFHYGRLDIGPETYPNMWIAYQRELDAILGKNPMIFVTNDQLAADPIVAQNAKTEAEIAAVDATMGGAKINQEMGTFSGSGTPTDPNASTIDPKLRAAMMGNITTEGAAEKAANLNAGAAG